VDGLEACGDLAGAARREFLGAAGRTISTMQRLALGVLFVLGCVSWSTAGTAHAGMVCDDAVSVKSLETVAKDPKATPEDPYAYCLPGIVEQESKYGARVLAACSKILARDPKGVLCIELAVRLGKKEYAGVDLYAAVAGWKIDVWNWDRGDLTLILLGKLGDHRAAPLIVDAWKANLDEAQKREKKKWASSMMAWSGWRKDAAAALGAVGGADDKAFLDEQAQATKDKYVRQACLDAVAAIDKRLAPPKP
jgi:hypothetical protein